MKFREVQKKKKLYKRLKLSKNSDEIQRSSEV
jgi:hypothetical protein